MVYQGLRFQARRAGKPYGGPFGVDAAFAEPLVGLPELITGSALLQFIGIPGSALPVYPIETHLAEKLHAYTMKRSRPNSRVKDLPDIALLATAQPIDAKRLRAALEQTFTFRRTHALPATVPAPLAAWATSYAAISREDQLPWPTLDEVTKAAQTFLDPVLAGELDATWEPETWSWR